MDALLGFFRGCAPGFHRMCCCIDVLLGFVQCRPGFCPWMCSGVLSMHVLLGLVRGMHSWVSSDVLFLYRCAPGCCPWMHSRVLSVDALGFCPWMRSWVFFGYPRSSCICSGLLSMDALLSLSVDALLGFIKCLSVDAPPDRCARFFFMDTLLGFLHGCA